MSSHRPIIILDTSQQWDNWYFGIRSKATKVKIFNYVDPALPSLPTQPVEPPLPTRPVPAEGTTAVTAEQREDYQLSLIEHKALLKKYKEVQKALNELSDLIEDSVSASALQILRGAKDSQPYNQLRALKQHLAPSDHVTQGTLVQQLDNLRKGPKNQSIDKWLLQWEDLARKAEVHDFPHVKGNYGAYAFLNAIYSHNAQFAAPFLMDLQRNPSSILSITYLTEQYRQWSRGEHLRQPHGKESSFAATLKGEEQPQKPPTCLCGENHLWKNCPYLNEKGRPSGWTPVKEVQARVQKKMSNPPIKAKVEASLARHAKALQQKKDNKSPQDSPPSDQQDRAPQVQGETFAAQITTTFAAQRAVTPTTLEQSWITDTGSSHHVCNRYMKKRYTKTRDASPEETITSGNSTIPVKSFGTVTVYGTGPEGSKPITLLDVAYVPSFMANLVSIAKVMDKGVHMDTSRMHLHKDHQTVYKLERYRNHFYLELNKAPNDQKSSAIVVGVATRNLPATQWHEIFAHAGKSTIQALPASTEGAEVQQDSQLSQHCDVCARTKAHQLISRSASHEESSQDVFFRVSYDMINMIEAYNEHQWISHVECAKSNYTLAATHRSKSESADILLSLLSKIERRFERKPVFLRSDNEATLGNAFNAEIDRRGITRETSAPQTSQQNGHAERVGKTIIEKARALRVSARLPDNLWPETVNAAVYLMNRTPMQRIGWKTPFELVHGKKPSIAHLRVYGCKAYALNKSIPRKEKLQERVLVGYLVGYDSTNIYRIWCPPSKRIIRSRDVTFDEDSRYSQYANETYGELSDAEDEPEEAPTMVRPRIWLSNSDTEASDSDVEEETVVEDTPSSSPKPARSYL